VNAPAQPIPTVSHRDVTRILRRDSAPQDFMNARRILKTYGGRLRDPSRVHLAVLKLAAGSLEKLRFLVDQANLDSRDVVGPAEYPNYGSHPLAANLPDNKKQEIFAADWEQYQTWLQR
jgi:hypothetical protein